MNPMHETYEKSISVKELLVLLKRYLILILAAGLLGGIVAYVACSYFVSPVYQASAKMIVNSRQEQTGSLTNDQITSSQRLVNTYAIIIRSRRVLEPVIETLQLPMSVESLASMITVTAVNNTQVMQISVQSSNPNQAKRIVEQIVSICPPIIVDAVDAGSVKTIETASINWNPIAPRTSLYTMVAALLCVVVGVVIVAIIFLLDNTYKSEMMLRNDLDLPVLGVIPDRGCCTARKYEAKEGKHYGKVQQ